MSNDNFEKMMFDDFAMHFPTIHERVVDHRTIDTFELLITLNNDTLISYDYMDKSIRYILRSGESRGINLSEETWKKEFSTRLKKKMAEKNISGRELARITGISTNTISRYTTCRNIPNSYNLRKIAIALGCSIHDLNIFMD